MKQSKGKNRFLQIRTKLMITFVAVMMMVSQLPSQTFVHAESTIAEITLNEADMISQRIEIKTVKEGVTKLTLAKDGSEPESRDVSEDTAFEVCTNGEYIMTGYDEQGNTMGEQTITVDTFSELIVRENSAKRQVDIVSRNPAAFQIRVNEEALLEVIETKRGVYQAVYDVEKKGSYTFSVQDTNGEELGKQTLEITDIPSITKDGEIILSEAADMKQIVANPNGRFILDQDIELEEDSLSGISFTGTLDGDGYTISGITERLFSTASHAVITNIVIEGRLSDSADNTEITNAGFYVEGDEPEKDIAVILNGTDVSIKNSFAFMNAEGKNAAGFILNGSAVIENSYVSGYLKAKKAVYGFGRDVDVKNSYITASLIGTTRVMFSNGENTDCFYDAQINDLEDGKATPYFTKDMISGALKNEGFSETKGSYPQIKAIQDFKTDAQSISALSVVSVSTNSNLSALEGSVDYEETKEIDWKKSSDQIQAKSNNVINRFALDEPETIKEPIAGASTTETSTQIKYPVVMGTYYKVMKSEETLTSEPKDHKTAMSDGWKLMYWSGTNTASGLDWNTEYTIYSTDLSTVTSKKIATKYGKSGGKLTLTGNYSSKETMTAKLSGTNAGKGTLYFETAETLNKDAEWTVVQTEELSGTVDSDTNTYAYTGKYTVKDAEKGKYLRARFAADKNTGYEGEIKTVTAHPFQELITAVTIENKTSSNSTMTIQDELIASIVPAGKDGEVTFAWYREGEADPLTTGRNYTLKKEDIGKKLYVAAAAKDGGELKGNQKSALTEAVQAIRCSKPDITKLQEKAHDDITVTLSMDTTEGLYQFGYAMKEGENITPYTTLSRAKTELTMTGLSANQTYYIYVRQVGENGYTDSEWSDQAYSFKTDAEHVSGDVIIRGDAVYNKTLTAEITNKPEAHKGKFVWYRLDENEERIPASKTEGTSYPLKKEDIGHKIEAVYAGNGDYAGEVTNISETIAKEEKEEPETNLTTGTATDTEIPITMPKNSTGEMYILGISTTQNGIPIEQQEAGSIKEFGAEEAYTIKNLDRNTTYFLFIRYAANETHQKSDWIAADKAVSKTTTKKEFSGTITFTYEAEANTLIKGQTVKATLNPMDASFNYKGTWTWTKYANGVRTPIVNFSISNDRHSTSYVVPANEDTGAVYEVKFEANVGYYGSQVASTSEVQEPVKGKYEKPNVNSIVMEPIDDSSIKLMMSEGEGLYQFYYREDDENPADSINGFFTKLLSGDDGYSKADKIVGANVDLVIEGLKRNTRYIVKVERVGDSKFETSDAVYSSAAATEYKSVTTMKTEIAGHVTLSGDEVYGGIVNAKYNEATYASKGSGSDKNGKWKWYRDTIEITGETNTTYTLTQADIGKAIKAVYTIPDDEAFQGSVDASTKTIEKADCVNPEITSIESMDTDGVLTMRVTGTKAEGDNIYYRLQDAADAAPVYPNTAEQLKDWHSVTSETIDITKDANNLVLKANANYTIYYIKQENDTQKGSAVISKTFTMGTKSQTGTIAFNGDFVVGKTVTAALKAPNNTKGTWHWYMSTKRYGYDGLSAMPDSTKAADWTEITGGFSPVLNESSSTLAITDDMFAHYIRAEFVADKEQGFSGEVRTTEEQFVKKVYEETVSITSSTKDGNEAIKAYSKSVITGTVNKYAESGDIDRTTVRFKIANSDGSGAVYVDGADLDITDNEFTHTMEANQNYDGKEITAEVSTPKHIALFVDKNLNAVSEETLNSNISTKESVPYTYGIPISNATDLTNFLKKGAGYTDRSATYILTNDINMSQSDITPNQVTAAGAFSGTLDGDYHTVTEMKTYFITWLNNGRIKNMIIFNSKAARPTTGPNYGGDQAWRCATALVAYVSGNNNTIENIMLTQSDLHGSFDGGSFVGKNYSKGLVLNNCVTSGVTLRNEETAAHFMGGLVGYQSSGTMKITNSYSINSEIVDKNSSSWLGGILGGTDGTSSELTTLENVYFSGVVPTYNQAGAIIGKERSTYNTATRNIKNSFYDSTIMGNAAYPYEVGKAESYVGKKLNTQEMIGDSLSSSFGNDGTWVYNKGYYPRLAWCSEHSVTKLYTATRGAFLSVDGMTSDDEMFNGNIHGVIQIPTELQTKDYTVTSSNEKVLKIGDNGTIIPVADAVGMNASITITYDEPDAIIGGSASNTYEFTIKEAANEMDPVKIQNQASGTELMGSPKMNQTLKAYSTAAGSSYQWYRRKSGTTESMAITDAKTQLYTVQPDDIGYEFAVLVKADGYASTYSSFTAAAVAIKPDAPAVSDITDNSVVLKPVNGESGLTYEFGYVRADENVSKTIVEEICDADGSVAVENLERNRRYNFYVRVAAKDGSYEAGDWSEPISKQLEQTAVEGAVLLGTAINNGTVLTMRIESVNGQTGTWKLERLSADSDIVENVIDDGFSTENDTSYIFKSEDVGKRIRATYTGRGNYKGAKSAVTAVIKNSIPTTTPSAPIEIDDKKTDSALTVMMTASGTYDIGLAESSNAEIDVRKNGLAADEEFKIEGLKRNTAYYVYARTSKGNGTEASNWSKAGVYRTAKTNVTGDLSITGNLMTDSMMKVKAPSMSALTGSWKVERVQGGSTTTIAPKDYKVDTTANTVSYTLTPKDAHGSIVITLTGTGDYQGSITRTSSMIQNAKQDKDSDMPEDVNVTDIKDHTVNVAANSGTGVYQFGYAAKGEADTAKIIWNDATGEAGKAIQLSDMERDSEYDIYVRKAAKTGYDASDPIKLPTCVKTEKTILNGSLDYIMQDDTLTVGVAEIGKTYTASYTSGTYEQSGSDTGGSWQWYADEQPITGATSASYKIEAMEGTPEISVRYIAKADSGFDSFVKISVGTLTKPVFPAPSVLPVVTAAGEDGDTGSKLNITSTDFTDVFYYVQQADNTIVPNVKTSSEVKNNEPALKQWFKADDEISVSVQADTEYVVYAARLDDGEHQSSGVVSQRAVRSAKEELDKLDMVKIKESDSTKWKVLQEKELRIDINNKAVDGIWQYYVNRDKTNDNSWQNITSEINAKEGKTATYANTFINMPVKYHDYYVKVVFTGRGSYKGNKVYTSTEKLSGTQIKGSVQITSGDSSQVFTPIIANYVFAKNPDDTDIIDEENGFWTWYRETGIGSNEYVKIEQDEIHYGKRDTYIPTADDVDRKLYAEYTGALTGNYSGSVQSNHLNNVAKSLQETPSGLELKQVNGTTVQLLLPTNYKPEGKAIPETIVEYREQNGGGWIVNKASNAARLGEEDQKLKANTTYEIQVKFAGTKEYQPSAYSNIITATTGNQLFDEDNLSIEADGTLKTDSKIKAIFTGSGYDEGYFIIKRSDGTTIKDKLDGTVSTKTFFNSGTNAIEYTVTSADIGSNIVIQYQAKENASTYGGYIEKNTKEVSKPTNPKSAGTPELKFVQFDKTALTAVVSDDLEYVFNDSVDTIKPNSKEWEKLTPDSEKDKLHTFTGLDEKRVYYLHARYAETQEYSFGEQSVKTDGTSTWTDTTHFIHDTPNVINDNSKITYNNPSDFTELSEAIILEDASRDGYDFLGWTSVTLGITEITKNMTIPKNTTKDIEVVSHWELLNNPISYELNGGALKAGETNRETYTIEDETFTLNNPERKGYTFTGWTWADETTPQTTVQIKQGSFGEKSYTANWKLNEYKISYELGGGTNAGSNSDKYTVESEKITISEPVKTGYDFLGWTWDGQSDAVMNPVIETGSIGNMTYTANWKATEYVISYNLDNGTLETDKTNPEKYTIESEDITLNNPVRTGYTFKGWSTGDDNNPIQTVTITKGSTGAKSYKAMWEENKYTITYVMDGGTNHEDNPSTYKVTDAEITLQAPSRTGYVFKGWKADGAGEAQETVTIASGSTGNRSYTATWEKAEYRVIFDSKEGSAVSQAGVKFEEKITKPTDPTKEGHTFAGWFKETTLDNEWNFENDVVTANITLYAKWTVNQYTATFDVNGGDSVDPATITKNYQEELETLPVATRTGYSFAGWFTAATDGDKITDKTKMPVDGAAYYAHWTINQYTVKFDGNKGSDGGEIKKDYDAAIGELPTSTRAGYTFDGWYTEKTDGTKVEITTKVPAKDVTYYAHWTINQYTAKFDGNEGSDGTDITADYNSELQTLPTSTREGYTFDGWYTAKTGGTKILTTTKMPLDGATYYAHWKTVDYTITYDLNDGSSGDAKNHEDNPTTYTIESNVITLQNPTWTGRVFTGWTWDGHDTKELVVTINKGTTGNKTYKANWELAAYTVTFDSQGGSDVADVPAQHGKPIVQPSYPVKEGYTFKGWYTTKAYDAAWNFDDAVMGDMPLYAKWEINHYVVSFNTNDGSSVDAQTVDHGNKASLPTEPTREHYEFAGWYRDDKLTTEFDFANTEIKGETTIYAKWTPVIYNITYDLDGGSVTLDKLNPIFYTVETESFTLNNPTKTGYEFKGWSAGDDSKAETAVTITKGTSGDLSYKALWEKKSYTIAFESKGGSAVEDAHIKYEEMITKPSDPTKAGYTFAGWYKETACENVWDFDKDVVSNETTLYAKWTANRYTAVFDKNDGNTVSPASIEKDYQEELGTLPTAARTGYSFAGWFTAATGGDQITDKTKMPLDGATYYAQWMINQYTVKFDGNGGSHGTDITSDYDSELETLPTSSRAGYTFAGWYTEKIGGTKVETTTKVPAKDVTYYAHWTINQYTVKFDGNGGSNGKNITVDYDSELGTLPTSTRAGYTFDGWYTEKTGGTKILTTTKMPLDGATYYAQWKTVDYTITYDLNDKGSGEAVNHKDNPLTYTIESSVITLKAPSWKNYVFTGWTWDGHDTKELIVKIDSGTTGNKTYKANWVESNLTVKFDTQGGSVVEDALAAYGIPISKPDDPTREGYTFTGWYTSDTFETEWNFDHNVKDHMTLYAKWDIKHYSVTFHTGGGSVIDKQIIDHGEKAGEPAEPTKAYYVFAGWYCDEKLTKEFKFDSAIKADTILYAKWIPMKYDITYELDGGDNHKDNPADYTVEEEIILKAPVKKNYTFLGWTYEGQNIPQKIVTIVKGTHSALRYTAHWKLKEYTVDFKANQENTIASIPVRHGDKAAKPEKEPVKAGYVFTGWYQDEACTREWDFYKDVVTGKTTLYAGYKEILKTVSADPDAGYLEKGDEVTLHASKGAQIYYTTDGTKPTQRSMQYLDSIIIDKTVTIRAIAVKAGYADSEAAEFTYYVRGEGTIDTGQSPIKFGNKPDELIAAVLQEEEYARYLNGENVKVRISCSLIQKQETEAITKLLDGRSATHYYDITLYKTIGEREEEQVEKLRKPIRIVMEVPKELYPKNGVTREFKVLRIHEGKNALLDDLDEQDETVTFESDVFSTYILCYKDSSDKEAAVKPQEKAEGDLEVKGEGTRESSTHIKQPALESDKAAVKEDKTEKKSKQPAKETGGEKAEKQEANDTLYFFLFPLAALLALCIAFVIRIKRKSGQK